MVYTSKACPENTVQSVEVVESTGGGASTTNGGHYNSNKWYSDHAGYKQALKISLSRKAPILIYGRTDWCPYCIKLDKTFLSNWEVNKVLSGFVKVKLNPEHSAEDDRLFKSLGGKGYPSLFVQSGEKLIKKIRAPYIEQGEQRKVINEKTEAFIAILQNQLGNYQ